MINENNEATVFNQSATTMALLVASVALKIPPFWPNDPLIWFAQVEAQFHTCQIMLQTTKFSNIAPSLPQEIAKKFGISY